MKVKYFKQDGTEEIVEVGQKDDGTIILPKDLHIPCGCDHDSAVDYGAWPATVVFLTVIVAITTIILAVING